jgi:hypothetical protein
MRLWSGSGEATEIVWVFKNGWFAKFARKERISDRSLCEAVARVEAGLIDADLGGGLIKQRVARPGAGESGGYRTLIFFRIETRAVFAFGFAKTTRRTSTRRRRPRSRWRQGWCWPSRMSKWTLN